MGRAPLAEPGAWRRVPSSRHNPPGFTLLEVIIAVAIFSIVLIGVLSVWIAGLRNDVQVYGSVQLEDTARDTLNFIVRGDTFTSPTIKGLVEASEVGIATSPVPALAYRVKGITSTGVEGYITVTYYLSSGKLYRVVVDYGTSLVLTTTGGVEKASNVERFGLSAVVDPVSGRKLVSIDLTLKSQSGDSFNIKTTVLPRNQPTGS